jgi:hypothetical protein
VQYVLSNSSPSSPSENLLSALLLDGVFYKLKAFFFVAEVLGRSFDHAGIGIVSQF